MFKYILSILIILLYTTICFGGEITLAWDANSESNIKGYKIYYGPASHTYNKNIDTGKVTTYTVNNIPSGEKLYYAVTAYDTSNNESDYSNEVFYTVPTTPPSTTTTMISKPHGIRIQP